MEGVMMTLYEEVRAALGSAHFTPRKKLGQNFLVHENVIASILRLLQLSPRDAVLEIGPGLGFLTRRMVEIAAEVWAVEVDTFLADWLMRSPLGTNPKFHLLRDDVLKVSLDQWLPARKFKLAANLPYSISTPVLFRVFDWRDCFSSLVLMVQKEVADRIAAKPGTKAYGTLSVWCQAHGRVTDKVSVAPEAFVPRPDVRSTVLKIELHEKPLVAADEVPLLRGLVRAAFGQRRKTLRNALSSWLNQDREAIAGFLRSQGIDPRRRGETLSVDEFIKLGRSLKPLAPRPAAKNG
jgi:16S rRNA (adenine1518-N6/adenine1519-N6)-dimethyltransferase